MRKRVSCQMLSLERHRPSVLCNRCRASVGDAYVTMTGYLEVGELNNIVMLFPQTIRSGLDNPNGCWDWWGYTDGNYRMPRLSLRPQVDTPEPAAIRGADPNRSNL